MKNYMTIAIRPDTYEEYKQLKIMGYSWNSIVREGIKSIRDQNPDTNPNNIIDKFQKKLTELGTENELLRMRIKRTELREKLDNKEISIEEYQDFKKMYDESIISIEKRIQEENIEEN